MCSVRVTSMIALRPSNAFLLTFTIRLATPSPSNIPNPASLSIASNSKCAKRHRKKAKHRDR